MIMDELKIPIQTILQKEIDEVRKALSNFCQKRLSKAIIQTGAWSNQSIITAYTSVFPTGNSSEESIDLVMQLKFLENSIEFLVDISRSNGELLEEICEEIINYSNKDKILAQIDNLSKKAGKLLVIKFASIIHRSDL